MLDVVDCFSKRKNVEQTWVLRSAAKFFKARLESNSCIVEMGPDIQFE